MHKKDSVNISQVIDFGKVKASAFQSSAVHTTVTQWIARGGDIRRHVAAHQRAASENGVCPDFYELVDGRHSTQYGVIVNFYVSGNVDAVGEYALVAYDAVVRYVHVCHQQTIRADLCLARSRSTSVDGTVFAYDGVVTNDKLGLFALELQVLWNIANDGAVENLAVFAQASAFHDVRVRANPATIANDYVLIHRCERANHYPLANIGIGVHKRKWVSWIWRKQGVFGG